MPTRLLAVRGSLFLLLIWGAYHLTAQSEASLPVEIHDAGSGGIIPAMVCITSLDDHKWRTPPDGTATPPYSKVREFYDPAPWTPGQIGLVRLTTAEPHDGQGRVMMYDGQRLERLEFIEKRLKVPEMNAEYSAEEEALRKRIAEARVEYQKLSREGRE